MKTELTILYNQNPAGFAQYATELLNKPMPMRVYQHVETGKCIAAMGRAGTGCEAAGMNFIFS